MQQQQEQPQPQAEQEEEEQQQPRMQEQQMALSQEEQLQQQQEFIEAGGGGMEDGQEERVPAGWRGAGAPLVTVEDEMQEQEQQEQQELQEQEQEQERYGRGNVARMPPHTYPYAPRSSAAAAAGGMGGGGGFSHMASKAPAARQLGMYPQSRPQAPMMMQQQQRGGSAQSRSYQPQQMAGQLTNDPLFQTVEVSLLSCALTHAMAALSSGRVSTFFPLCSFCRLYDSVCERVGA